jgi:hypothetical protein
MLKRVSQVLFLVCVSVLIADTVVTTAYGTCDNKCRQKFKFKACSTDGCFYFLLTDCFPCAASGVKGLCKDESDYDPTKPNCKASLTANQIYRPDTCTDICTCAAGIDYIQADMAPVANSTMDTRNTCQP